MASSRGSSPRRSRSRSGGRRERRDRDIKPSKAKVFVTNIDAKYSADEIRTELTNNFERYGEIIDIVVKTKSGSDNIYGFIEFKSVDHAEKAIQNMKGKEFMGKPLTVEMGNNGRKSNKEGRSQDCYICRRPGHIARDCPDNRGSGRRSPYDRRRGNSRDRYSRDRNDKKNRRRTPSRDRKDRYERRSRSRSSEDRYKRESRYQRKGYEKEREKRRYSSSRSDEKRRERRRNSRERSPYEKPY